MPLRSSRGRNRRRAAPTLLETQRAMRASLVDGDRAAAAMLVEPGHADRIDIYRNTFVTGVTKALRLTYPAVHRLGGAGFFQGAAAPCCWRPPPPAPHLGAHGG